MLPLPPLLPVPLLPPFAVPATPIVHVYSKSGATTVTTVLLCKDHSPVSVLPLVSFTVTALSHVSVIVPTSLAKMQPPL
jgi:hypothetical protein